jgi:hypothetical protein
MDAAAGAERRSRHPIPQLNTAIMEGRLSCNGSRYLVNKGIKK